jgi:hypothetical protein
MLFKSYLTFKVEVALLIDNITRYADNGTVRFKYTSANLGKFLVPSTRGYLLKTLLEKHPVTELALCTVFQNQALYLREWIAFHTISYNIVSL